MTNNGLSGLSNLGNTCYINSCVQILSHSYELNEILNNIDKVNKLPDAYLLVEWNKLRELMWSKNVTISPGRFIKTIQHVSKEKNNDLFSDFSQQDSAEFLIFCIECFHNSIKKKQPVSYKNTKNKYLNKGYELTKSLYEKEYSSIHQLFHSIVINEIKSLEGKSLSIKAEHNLIFNLCFFKKTAHTLLECLDRYFSEELLENDNAWYNEKTKSKMSVYKSAKILYFPQIIIIDLKRWIDPFNKIKIKVDAPLLLDLSKYSVISTNNVIYELYGICNHRGGTMGGHYYANILDAYDGNWYEINDTFIKNIEPSKLITPNAYCFFYRKKK